MTDPVEPKRLVLGIGTGRSGTVSLANLLDAAPGTHITHEALPRLPWEYAEAPLAQHLKQFRERSEAIVGDVASYWLPYIEEILRRWEDVRIIYVERERAAVVDSFVIKMKGKKNHWMHHNGRRWRRDRNWDQCFPKYDVDDMATAIGLYWDEYAARAHALCDTYPDHIRGWKMEDALNTEAGAAEIARFIDIDLDGWSPETGAVHNKRRAKKQSFWQSLFRV